MTSVSARRAWSVYRRSIRLSRMCHSFKETAGCRKCRSFKETEESGGLSQVSQFQKRRTAVVIVSQVQKGGKMFQVMRQFQSMSRGSEARDFNLIQGNAGYVQAWSMVQCAVIVICTMVQVESEETLRSPSQKFQDRPIKKKAKFVSCGFGKAKPGNPGKSELGTFGIKNQHKSN